MKINTNFVRAHKRVLVLGVILVALAGVTFYQLMELRGLRARVHSIEYAATLEQQELEMFSKEGTNSQVKYEVLSKTTEDLRVEDTEKVYEEGEDTAYKAKKFLVYKLKVTNNMEYPYDYFEGEVKGKTSSGTLITPQPYYSVHPEDRNSKESVSLAPGGTAEIYIYLPADEDIVDLYYTNMGSDV